MSTNLIRSPDRSIVMVGLMGAGKSAIGRRLAGRADLPFIDADDEIEAAAGCSISEIFEFYGEPAFRDVERRVIARLMERPPCIISTGGGAFVDPQTRETILHSAISVWLNAALDILVERTSRRSHRPLLHGKDPHVVLKKLMDERNPYYAQASITVISENCPVDRTVDKVVDALNDYMLGADGNPVGAAS